MHKFIFMAKPSGIWPARIVVSCLLALMGCVPVLAGPVLVPEADAKKAAVSKPAPVISGLAKQMKLGGHVEIEAHIDETGAVESVKLVVGHPLLAAAATAAVKNWKFTPFQDGGAPAKAIATLSFDFKQ